VSKTLLLPACLVLGLGGCAQLGRQPPLISAASPPDAAAASQAEPQPVNSLPPGAEGVGPPSPTSRQENFLSLGLPAPF
jgi:hypothetical protein